jgi:hypothetical protein
MDNTDCQNIALLILNNCLGIADTQQQMLENKYAFFAVNTITTEESFLLKLFSLSHSSRPQLSGNALSCIFSIIYNNNEQFA